MPGAHRAALRDLTVEAERGEVLFLQLRHALDLDIAEAVEGEMGLERERLALGPVEILRLCRPQILIVEIALLQDLAGLDMHELPRGDVQPQFKDTGDLLAQVQHRLTLGGGDERRGLQRLVHGHRRAHAVAERSLGRAAERGLLERQLRQRVVPVLAVIEIGEGDV